MSELTSEDIAQFRKLATKERDIVKASECGWVGVYSALAMSLDRIAQLEAEVKEMEKQSQPREEDAHVCHTCDGTGWTYG